jgi:transforming growth factor-beta-induced protein
MRRSRTFKAFAVAAALSIPLAACGDDEDDAADEPDTPVVEDNGTDDNGTDDMEAPDDEAMEGDETIVDIAAGNPDFSTLVTAVTEAGLVDTLSGGEWTVFAPTNEAFDALPEGTLEDLLADPDGALSDVLTYHVVEGTVMAETVVTLDGEEVETVNGATVTISVDGDTVMVNDATVVTTDIVASNGVIHVIDAVLVP